MLSYNLINVYISWKKGGVFLAAIDSAYHYYLSTYGTCLLYTSPSPRDTR